MIVAYAPANSSPSPSDPSFWIVKASFVLPTYSTPYGGSVHTQSGSASPTIADTASVSVADPTNSLWSPSNHTSPSAVTGGFVSSTSGTSSGSDAPAYGSSKAASSARNSSSSSSSKPVPSSRWSVAARASNCSSSSGFAHS